MSNHIELAHGSGGELSHELITRLFHKHLHNPHLEGLGDSALLPMPEGHDLAMSTDSFVVQPNVFPGGDIGELAVCGTVNDIAVSGATPRYLTAGFVLEEGLSLDLLDRLVGSMARAAREAGVMVVAGDTKVVERGAADGLFINTAGVGFLPRGLRLTPANLRVGDVLLINGTVGDHGMAVMLARQELPFEAPIESDCASLNGLVADVMAAGEGGVRCMRDATRGGLATVLNEWADACAGIELVQEAIPLNAPVQALCEFLGFDPLYVANEGKVVVAVSPERAHAVLTAMRAHPLGQRSAIIGQVTDAHGGRVVLDTAFGGRRLLPMLTGAQLPRIC